LLELARLVEHPREAVARVDDVALGPGEELLGEDLLLAREGVAVLDAAAERLDDELELERLGVLARVDARCALAGEVGEGREGRNALLGAREERRDAAAGRGLVGVAHGGGERVWEKGEEREEEDEARKTDGRTSAKRGGASFARRRARLKMTHACFAADALAAQEEAKRQQPRPRCAHSTARRTKALYSKREKVRKASRREGRALGPVAPPRPSSERSLPLSSVPPRSVRRTVHRVPSSPCARPADVVAGAETRVLRRRLALGLLDLADGDLARVVRQLRASKSIE